MSQAEAPPQPLSSRSAVAITVFYLLLLAVSVAALAWIVFGAQRASLVASAGSRIVLNDGEMVLAVLAAGCVGSLIHGISSFVTYRGNRRLYASWALWYVMRPFWGIAMAVVFYVGVRGGLLVLSTADGSQVDPYGMMLVAALAGMFSKQASDKLAEVFDSMFGARGDAERGDKLAKPTPVITSLDPAEVSAGSGSRNLVVRGKGFVAGSQVFFDAEPRATLLVSDTEIHATLNAQDTAAVGVHQVTVGHPREGGGISAAAELRVVAVPAPGGVGPAVEVKIEKVVDETGTPIPPKDAEEPAPVVGTSDPPPDQP